MLDVIEIGEVVAGSVSVWHSVKDFAERATAVSPDALHVLAGVVLQLLVAALLRRSVSSWLPWLCLLAMLSINEALDIWSDPWPSVGMQLAESAKDLILTMILPTLLLFAARKRNRLFADQSVSPARPESLTAAGSAPDATTPTP